MSDKNPLPFSFPGLDILQQMSGMGKSSTLGRWIAPTMDVDEIDRRIRDLKTVQFWLEQNVMAVKATIQALEVQKMTLETLRSMNLNMAEMARAFTIPLSRPRSATEPEPAGQKRRRPAAEKPRSAPPEPEVEPEPDTGAEPDTAAKARADAPRSGPAPDPMLWWGSLTRQFQQIALQTLQDAADRVDRLQTPNTEKTKGDGGETADQKKAGTGGKKAAASKTGSKAKPAATSSAGTTAGKKTAAKKTSARKTAAKKTSAKKAAAKKSSSSKKKAASSKSESAAAKKAGSPDETGPRDTTPRLGWPLSGWPLPFPPRTDDE